MYAKYINKYLYSKYLYGGYKLWPGETPYYYLNLQANVIIFTYA